MTWIQEYSCGCSTQNRSRAKLLGYCATHGNEPRATYRMDEASSLFAARMELQQLRADLAAAQKRCDEAYGNVSALFVELCAISGMTHLGGEVDDYTDVTKAVEKIVDELAAARAALEAVEWVVDIGGNDVCPWCEGDKPIHAPDCARQVALGLAKKPEEGVK